MAGPMARVAMGTGADALAGIKTPLAVALTYIVAVKGVTALTGAGGVGPSDLSALAPEYIWAYVWRRITPFFIMAASVAALWVLYDHFVRRPDSRDLARRLTDLLRPLARPAPWLALVIFALVFMLFMNSFVAFKAVIPQLQPFAWDSELIAWDRMLHGGVDAWRLTWALFDAPWATRAIDVLYGSWFVVVFSAPFASVMFDPDPRRRFRFLTSHLLVWAVLGSVGAAVFSSVGPCYFAPVFGPPDPFAPLMERLHAVHDMRGLVAVQLQDLLWRGYVTGSADFQGISAMPSLHVAQVALLAFAASAFNRPLAVAAWLYTAVIQLGSVHLGWHYAVDGYVGILGAGAVWWAVGRVIPRDRSAAAPDRADAG